MQRGQVDLVIVGRTGRPRAATSATRSAPTEGAGGARQRRAVLRRGAVAVDRLGLRDGLREIPIENRSEREVTTSRAASRTGASRRSRLRRGQRRGEPAFDVTPARLVTGIVTERGIAEASEAGLRRLFPEHYGPETHERD